MNETDQQAAKARVRAKNDALRQMPAREYIANLLHATRTHAEVEAMLAEVEQEARTAGSLDQQRELRRLELLETNLINYINRADTPDMVGHILTGMLALAEVQASDEFPDA